MARHPLCKDKHPDGRVCALYLDHYGDHKENHLRSSWSDEDVKKYIEEQHQIELRRKVDLFRLEKSKVSHMIFVGKED